MFALEDPFVNPTDRSNFPADSTDSKTRVLLVDDNDDVREVIGVGLELLGYQIAGAPNGNQAIEQLLAFQPDILIMDQGLPDILGIEVGRQIRALENASQKNRKTLLVLLTGTDGQALRELATQAGFDGFFVKPIRVSTISEWIQSRIEDAKGSSFFPHETNPGIEVSLPESFTVASFAFEGTFENSEQVATADLNSDTIQYFSDKFSRLSGDLELPFEGRLTGDLDAVEYQICSEFNGAYILYYLGDDIIFASLLLRGVDENAETELAQVFKFLLLDTDDDDDPTEEEIDEILGMDEFDFFAIDVRPVVFQIPCSTEADDLETSQAIARMDRHLAAAFLGMDRNGRHTP